MDLWSFEDDLELGDLPSKLGPSPSPRGSGTDIPAPRKRRITSPRKPGNPLEGPSASDGDERIQMNVSKSRPGSQSGTTPLGLSRTESEFDDLEHWDDVPKITQIDDLLPPPAQEPVVEAVSPEAVKAAVSVDAEDDEFSPVKRADAKPLSLHPHLRLSKLERVGLIVLLALLVTGGLATVVFSLKRLPTQSMRVNSTDFPIKGSMVVVDSAISYWRAPITDGPSPETVRRGTQLLPVLELRIKGGTGAIRVLFRNDERTAVGDAVTHAIRGADTLIIPATAGFDNVGMHAAYRTGGSKPWTIEVFEAASETSPGKDFQKLFEMNISTDRR